MNVPMISIGAFLGETASSLKEAARASVRLAKIRRDAGNKKCFVARKWRQTKDLFSLRADPF
jgi:hypothetical protein